MITHILERRLREEQWGEWEKLGTGYTSFNAAKQAAKQDFGEAVKFAKKSRQHWTAQPDEDFRYRINKA